MATYTDNYQYTKPTMAETADIRTLNSNFDKTDTIEHATQISLAPAYDSTQSYDTDDVVMYEFLMYKCKEDNVTGAWDATKWERTTASEVGSGGGGGSSVVPNPQGSATDTLTKIEIDGTIYDIEGSGGGGGGAFTVTDLYDIGDASLSDSIDNYDMLAVYYGVESEFSSLSDYKIFTVDDVNEMYTAGKWLICTGYSTRVVYFKINGTTLTIGTSEGSQAILKIRGIKCGGSSEDISDMTWTLLTSTTGTSSATAIPSGTKYLVLTAELGGYVSMVAKESLATIEKLATVAGATFNQGYEYADIAGNHTTIAMSVSSGDVTIKSGYNTVTAKVYAVS